MTNLPLISVVIPNHNGSRFLDNCLRSLQSQTYPRMEIVVVDNGSSDRSIEIVRKAAPNAVLLAEERNLGFAGAVNAGIRSSHGEWIAVLNNDTEVPANWLAECAGGIQRHSDAVFFACRILNLADRATVYSAGDCYLRAGIGYRRGQDLPDGPEFRLECPVFSACGCAALYRRDVLHSQGAFDDRFFAYLEDVDLGLRLQFAGYRGYYLPSAEVYHLGAATSGGEFSGLAVRLRTRNALLLLLKSLPAECLLRSLPMILLAQLCWLIRVLAHARLWPYVQGLGGALRLAPAMIRDRAGMRQHWRNSRRHFWKKIMESESQARDDFIPARRESGSLFLKWYFRIF